LLPSLEAHIQKAEEQKKAIDEKWNGKIKYVDTQMLQLRSLFDTKKRRLDELLKEVRNWEIRKYVFRDED
jgi:predicted  nucleic acid-binding Zn-ribbon protein